jgi:co-chaperonin GroES (HSP10)
MPKTIRIKQMLGDKILILMDVPPEKIGHIFIPDCARAADYTGPAQVGRVELVGSKVVDTDGNPMTVKPGERYFIGAWAGTEFDNDGVLCYKICQGKHLHMRDERKA